MHYGFGIDVGGTSIKLGLFRQDGALLEKWEIPTDTREHGQNILPDIARAIEQCCARHQLRRQALYGLGIGVPGPVDQNGVVNRCGNLGWGVFSLPEALGRLTGLPVKAGTDANVAALGECRQGGGRGCRNMVLITLGTGIGGGIVLDGKIVHGAHGAAGEIGHITLNPAETEPCSCGNYGCAEQYGSATGLVRLARRALAGSRAPSALRQVDAYSARDIFTLAHDGDRLARDILEEYYEILGRLAAAICCVADPEALVLGGGVSRAGQPLLDGVRRHFLPHMFHTGHDIRFSLAQLGNDAGIHGGFQMLLDAIQSPETR